MMTALKVLGYWTLLSIPVSLAVAQLISFGNGTKANPMPTIKGAVAVSH